MRLKSVTVSTVSAFLKPNEYEQMKQVYYEIWDFYDQNINFYS